MRRKSYSIADGLLFSYFCLYRFMKSLFTLALTIVLALSFTAQAMQQPSFHTKGTPTGKPTGPLKPGEYWWHPELSPSGPLMVLVSVPEQTMHVYRNGILIGRSTREHWLERPLHAGRRLQHSR